MNRKELALAKARNEIANFVDDLIATGVDLRGALARAADNHAEFEKLAHEKLRVMAIVEAPKAIKAMSHKASKGDVQAAKLILDLSGAMPRPNSGGVSVFNQINIPQSEKDALEQDLKGVVIDVE